MQTQIRHLGIIMDGNRRFAKRLMLKPWKGHDWGARQVESVLDWCLEFGIPEVTLWSFSIENMDRPKDEYDYLMGLFEKEFKGIVTNKRIHENRVRVRVIGRPDLLPENVQNAIREAEDSTKDYDSFRINFAIAYGGRQEILDAAKKLAEDAKSGKIEPKDLDADRFSRYLYNDSPDPDLIIRTSGEKRTSGFLIWQAAYAELYFSDKFWPEFQKEDLKAAIDDYRMRKRRFGK